MNRNNVIFHHDNARPYVAKSVTKKLSGFNWDILPHPPYSPDIVLPDYHLFRALQHFLVGKKFENIDILKNSLENYFKEKQENFLSRRNNGPTRKMGRSCTTRGGLHFFMKLKGM